MQLPTPSVASSHQTASGSSLLRLDMLTRQLTAIGPSVVPDAVSFPGQPWSEQLPARVRRHAGPGMTSSIFFGSAAGAGVECGVCGVCGGGLGGTDGSASGGSQNLDFESALQLRCSIFASLVALLFLDFGCWRDLLYFSVDGRIVIQRDFKTVSKP